MIRLTSNKSNERDRDILDAQIQLTEIMAAVTHLKPNKSSGNDGLPGEFYKKKKNDQLGKILQMVFSECLSTNRIPESCRTARIIVIPKKDRNSINPQDFRLGL